MNVRRWLLRGVAITAAATALLLAWHWNSARQVALHQTHFLQAVEDRNWAKVSHFLADDYHDRWRQGKTQVLGNLRQALADFLVLDVREKDRMLQWQGGDALVKTRLELVGSGGPVAQFVMQRLDEFHEPFVFSWRRRSSLPWDWVLITVDQTELPDIPAEAE